MANVNIEKIRELVTKLESLEKSSALTPLDEARLRAYKASLGRLQDGTLQVGSLKAEALTDLE